MQLLQTSTIWQTRIKLSYEQLNKHNEYKFTFYTKQLANTSSVFYNVDRSLIQLMLQFSLQYLRAGMREARPTIVPTS